MTIFTEKLNRNYVKIVLNHQEYFLVYCLAIAQMSCLSIKEIMGKTFMSSRCDLVLTVRMGLSKLRKQAKWL